MVSGIIPPSCRSDDFASRVAALLAPGGLIAQWVWSDQRDAAAVYLGQHPFSGVHTLPHVPIRESDVLRSAPTVTSVLARPLASA